MLTLHQALSNHELSVLRVLGEWWELDLTGDEKPACVKKLVTILEALNMDEEIKFLPPKEEAAIRDLAKAGGKMPVPVFTRKHGEVRQMGPAALEREEPWFDPISPAEALWYRGFLFRAFDETSEGLGEFFFLPREIMPTISEAEIANEPTVGEAVAYEPALEPPDFRVAPTDAVDDLTTIMAIAQNSKQMGENWSEVIPHLLNGNPTRLSLLVALGAEIGMLRQTEEGLKPTSNAVGWLQKGREAQLRDLAEAWSSCSWNALRHTPNLQVEGKGVSNDPISARAALLDALPQSTAWHKISAVVDAIKKHNPDFQRPDGNYDTWYIRDEADGEFIKGFEHWDRVEGRMLAFILRSPLHWLGLVDVSADGELYRVTGRMADWLADQPVAEKEVAVAPSVKAYGAVVVPQSASRYVRFQVARVADNRPTEKEGTYLYQITPHSLHRAHAQGIMPARVIDFLEKANGKGLSAGIKRAIERWGKNGTEGRVEEVAILRVGDAGILDILRTNAKTSPFLGESLSDLAVVVLDMQSLRQAAIQLGLLLD